MRIFRLLLLIIFLCNQFPVNAQDSTYAERLGFPKGAKVVILHVDDVGMSYDSDKGAIEAMEKGVANSCSVMMPCPWVPHYVHYLKQHPKTDAGLHLTLTAEWTDYRWAPISGKPAVPGLVDSEGSLWHSVEEVVKHANADEVEREIRAQVDRAKTMGFEPTHLDSHMGTLFATPAFMERYLKIGIEYGIPVMFPGGHATLIRKQMNTPADQAKMLQQVGRQLWSAGLPVLDDLYNESYNWKIPENIKLLPEKLRAFKTQKYIEALKSLQPGITMIIMHCTATTQVFQFISDSGPVRKGDLLAMTDPAFKKALEREHIILTTWRELKERRDKLK
jgi:chitin disaccharide deacetylase